MRLNGPKRLTRRWFVSASILALAIFAIWRFLSWPDRPFNVSFQSDEEHGVVRVVDGDTLELANGDRVRLIGIDTPEFSDSGPEPFAEAAYQFTRNLVEGKRVRLRFDKERLDKYRRVLAFVYVGDTLVNEAIAGAGLGRVLTKYGYSSRIKKRLVAAEADAKRNRFGLWQTTGQVP